MILYRTVRGPIVQQETTCCEVRGFSWDDLVNHDDLPALLAVTAADAAPTLPPAAHELLPPIGGRQELWAAGVTYFRSRTARMEESQQAGGANFYDRVYNADRPELFFKATPHRVVGHGQAMHLRDDSKWIVPEPELTLVITRHGRIIGYTIGNDLSCRDIEGENPLYLPQAKTFDRCAAIGPGILVSAAPLPATTGIKLAIDRGGRTVVTGATELSQMKKPLPALVEYLFRDNTFPHGCLLMTGTGVVPPNDFTLQRGDVARITIDSIGTLENGME